MQENAELRVINVGLQDFYEALLAQGAKAAQIQWQPPIQQDEDIEELLDKFL